MSDLSILFYREEEVRRWKAENENTGARLQIANMRKRMAELISQYEPVNSLGVDREKLRKLFLFVDLNRNIELKDKEKI